MATDFILSLEQRKFYDDNGYLVINKLIDFESLYTFKKRFIELSKNPSEKGFITIVKDPNLTIKGLKGEDVINKMQEVHFDSVFSGYTEHPRLLRVVSQLLGPSLRCTNSMFINKPPGTGEHPPHQDLAYFPFRPAHLITATWTAVDHVTVDNGALWVIPGSHRAHTLYEHGQMPGALKLYHGILSGGPSGPRAPLEMAPGDTVFFHPLLVHGSGANVSKNYRKSLAAHYASEECVYVDVSSGPQARVAEDIVNEGKRRGFDLTYEEIWRYKSKSLQVPAPSSKL
ncbi:probable phytanoyl-CoA dioxygenase [Aricia agestis]|uniref:probable phytanoyl-CoA dioxygenase n=1 Tax=Aricia agestis TaxID=91739 RepID=UPI001C20663B|nr:probable phytanoyl-CoA dioxygenase [Aricia agestis]